MAQCRLVVLCFLVRLTQAVGIAVEAEPRIMRRQSGENSLEKGGVREKESRVWDACQADYYLGDPGSRDDTCSSGTATPWTRPVSSITGCNDAALRANAIPATPPIVSINQTYQSKYPSGCFVAPCGRFYGPSTTTPSGSCFFWNDFVNPDDLWADGHPVCMRKRYDYGTASTASVKEGACPTGYKRVVTEKDCDASAECLDLQKGFPYETGEGGVQHTAAQFQSISGCHLELAAPSNGQQDQVFINNRTLNDMHMCQPQSTINCPTTLAGLPICIVEQQLRCEATGNSPPCAPTRLNGNRIPYPPGYSGTV